MTKPQDRNPFKLLGCIRSRRWQRTILCSLALLTCLWLYTIRNSLHDLDLGYDRHFVQNGWFGCGTKCRAEKVRAAFLHAYHGYERYAAPYDELRPVTNTYSNSYNGWAATTIDSLDTMVLMGHTDEYERALKIVEKTKMDLSSLVAYQKIGFFETVIRYLGGLLSAYALTGDQILLARAEELADTLDSAFNSTSGLPFSSVILNEDRGPVQPAGMNVGIAEASSFHLEYTYLSKASGKEKYLNRSRHVMDLLANASTPDTGGMLPVWWSTDFGIPKGGYASVGAAADSGHEYLLKLYLLTGKTDKRSVEMYLRMTTQVLARLLYLSPVRNMLYVTDAYNISEGSPSHKLEHLSCFFPGLLALGAHTLPLDNLASIGIDGDSLYNSSLHGHGRADFERLNRYNLTDLHLWAAEGLTQTCYLTYADQASGLGPDEMWMSSRPVAPMLWIDGIDKWNHERQTRGRSRFFGKSLLPGLERISPIKDPENRDYILAKANYLLRPETVESLYILWRTTKQSKYRTWAWKIFQAIEAVAKTDSGYTHIVNVDTIPAKRGDIMPSFFLAETLKYLYLIFLDEDRLPLDRWVFNTEAHPLPIMQ